MNAGTGQFTQLKVNDGAGKVVTMSRQAGGADYAIQWPANVGAAGSVLQTDATGILSWVAIPSAPVSSVAGKTGAVTLAKEDISGLGTAAALNAGTSANNLVQLDAGAKIPDSLFPSSVMTTSTSAGGDLSGTYPNPTIGSNTITSVKIADGAVGSLSKVVSSPGSSGPNRLIATDTGTGTTIKDFYCTTIGHYLKWTGTTGFGCAAISSADISDAASANNANTIVKRDPSGNFSAGTVTANLNGNVTGNLTGKVVGSLQAAVTSKTANYNILDSDGIITANASSGNLNFTLPSAVGMTGRQYTIKKVDSSANSVTLSTSASQTIDGSATAQLTSQWQYLTVTSDGANWIITNSTGANAIASVQFSFSDVSSVATSTVVTSSTVTTTGSGNLTVSVSGSGSPQISINGGSWVTSGPITAGQTLAVRMTSSGSQSTGQTATITAGSFSVNWTVTTSSQIGIVLNGSSRNWADGKFATSCNGYRNPSGIYAYSGNTGDGVYQIDPDGNGGNAAYDIYCDMTTDGGGWTLAFKNPGAGGVTMGSTGTYGSLSCLQSSSSSCAAKISDADINLISGSASGGSSIGYRVSNTSLSQKYYFPKACVYTQDSCGNTFGSGSGACSNGNASYCMRYTATYSVSPTYIQCSSWGGHGAGLNAWHSCNGNSGQYTNVALTVRDNGYACQSGITSNVNGATNGSSNTCYGENVLMWIK